MMSDEEKRIGESALAYEVHKTNLDHPVIVEQAGKPVAVLLSMDEYETLRQGKETLSATAARRAADRALFRDLVGLALSSGEPLWTPQPSPHWRVPYRLIDGPVVALIAVDAQTGKVALSIEEREQLLERVAKLAKDA